MIPRRTLALAAVASVLFGGTFVGAKAGLSYLPPLLFVALRFDIAAVVLLGYVVATRSRRTLLPQTRGDVLGILATGLFAIGLANALIFIGQQSATSAVAAILFSLNPILTPVFAAVLLADERLSARGGLGMVIGLLGVGLVVNPDPAALLSGGMGKLVLFAGALAYIAYFSLLDTAGAIRANLVFYVVPVVSTLGGWAVLGETVSSTAVAGFVTIFLGFAVLGSDSIDARALLPGDAGDSDALPDGFGLKSD